MTTFNCPRCGRPSTPEQCPSCGRGPEPLLVRLAELDAALRSLSSNASSRDAVESERAEVLDGLGRLAASYRAAATPPTPPPSAPTPPPTPTPTAPAMHAPPQTPIGHMTPVHFPAAPPMTPPPHRPRQRGEVASKTVQTLLLSLGGLLVAADHATHAALLDIIGRQFSVHARS